MSYFYESDASIPTGWCSTTDDGVLPRLSSRLPKAAASDIEMQSPATLDGSEESGSEESGRIPAAVVTRMAEESSDEDSDFIRHKVRVSPPAREERWILSRLTTPRVPAAFQNFHSRPGNQFNGRKRGGKHKVYGKGKARFNKQNRLSRGKQLAPQPAVVETPEEPLPEGVLIGLGEGIVVEWSEAAFDVVFGGATPDEMRGMKTYLGVQTLEDPTLQAKQKARQLRKKHGIALDDCLDEFEKKEILSEQDMWYCPRCKKHRRASKKFDLWKTPDILVVHLKRFCSSASGRDKLDIHVDFPVEGLDLTKRVINQEEGKEEVFDLIAVDDHWGGSLGGGHYTAFAKNFIDGEWYEYNGKVTFSSACDSRWGRSALCC